MFGKKNLKRNTLLVLFLSVAGVIGIITPQNSVTELNGMTIFNCTTDVLAPSWSLSPNGNSPAALITAYCGTVSDSARYRVESPSGNPLECNLIVFDITFQQAGVYTCVGFQSGTPKALLTIIDPSVALIVDNPPDVVENDPLSASCSLTFYTSVTPASTLVPSLGWTTSPDPISSSDPVTVDNVITSTVTVQMIRTTTNPLFVCHSSFVLSSNGNPDYATNTPPNIYQWETSATFEVLYPPNQASIEPSSPECWQESMLLTCSSSSSNPSVQYQWTSEDGGTPISYDQTLIVPGPGEYICTAYNTIRGVDHIVTASVIINIPCPDHGPKNITK